MCVHAHAGSLARERALGTNISTLHVVNILENRAVAWTTFTFLCMIVQIRLI